MKKLPTAVITSLALTIGAFPPTGALAGHHHRGTVVIVSPAIGSRVISRSFVARPFVGPVFVRRFVPFGVVAAPVVIYAAPPAVLYAMPPVVYAPPPAAYSPRRQSPRNRRRCLA